MDLAVPSNAAADVSVLLNVPDTTIAAKPNAISNAAAGVAPIPASSGNTRRQRLLQPPHPDKEKLSPSIS